MSEPIMEFSDSPESPVSAEDATRRRGRPRSQDTIERDQKVFDALASGVKSKEQLVDELGFKPEHVYLSLWRLRRDGRVERTSDTGTRHAWRQAG